jgi:outer membrane protein assembly factor BamB
MSRKLSLGRKISPRPFVLWFLAAPLVCSAYTSMEVGVDSNLLVDGDRVLFAQSDGSLTALDINSGKVLYRDSKTDYSGTLTRVPQGILVLNSGRIALLNATNLQQVWKTLSYYAPNITSDALVSYDGNGKVECRDLKSGSSRWTFDLPGALEVIEKNGMVCVVRAAMYEDSSKPTLALLNLSDGNEIFRRTAASNVSWANGFFDGTNIFMTAGAQTGPRRSDFTPDRVLIWNTRGDEIPSIPITDDLGKKVRCGEQSFKLDHRTFSKGRVYYGSDSGLPHQSGKVLGTSQFTNETADVVEIAYDIGDNTILTERTLSHFDSARKQHLGSEYEIDVQTTGHRWTNLCSTAFISSSMAAAKGKVLIGTESGHVECFDSETGRPLWLYSFPVLRHTLSYSSHGMPPMMANAAAEYRKRNAAPPTPDFKPKHAPTVPNVIVDPAPQDPFRKLPTFLAIVWATTVVPLVLLIALAILGGKKSPPFPMGVLSAILGGAALIVYMNFGRVSIASSFGLRVTILASLAFGIFYAVKTFRVGRRALFVLLAVCLGILGFLFLPFALAL